MSKSKWVAMAFLTSAIIVSFGWLRADLLTYDTRMLIFAIFISVAGLLSVK